MSAWNTMPETVPADGLECLVRTFWWIAPFEATWDLSSQSFVIMGGLTIPWWIVVGWRVV